MIIVPQHLNRTKAEVLEYPTKPFEVRIAADESECTLNAAVVYHDTATRDQATQTCRRATQLAEEGQVKITWHAFTSFSDHELLLYSDRAAAVPSLIEIPNREIPHSPG